MTPDSSISTPPQPLTSDSHAYPHRVATVDPLALKDWLHDGREIALLDVREHGQYGEQHLFYGVNAPYSRLEIDTPRLVPNRAVRVVLYDSGEQDDVAVRAAGRLHALGYRDVHVLAGGVSAWKAAGLACFAGVNLPSKTFGELAEETYHTPRISAEDLAGRIARGENLVIIDGRPFAEYQKMNIPQALCCPNGELALRIDELVPDSQTPVVINCAGRTRSIIGAQTLINLGLPNPVYALENGTQGWYLADLTLEHGSDRRYADVVENSQIERARSRAQSLATRFHVPTVDADTVRRWTQDATRTLFLCDVRTAEEFERGTLPGAQHTPGGQLIQATDQYLAVRGARIVVFDSDGARAPAVSSWLVQMGWDASVLKEGVQAGDLQLPPRPVMPRADTLTRLDPHTLAERVTAGATIKDVRSSAAFRAGHIAGAQWDIRPTMTRDAASADQPVVVVGDDETVVQLAAQELISSGRHDVAVSVGSPDQWREAGLTIDATPDCPPDDRCIDFLFFVHDRHSGNKAAARQYLAWETDLVHQIDERERAVFQFPDRSGH